MAVCGRCIICGHKFAGDTTPDVGAYVHLSEHAAEPTPGYGFGEDPKICVGCIEALYTGTSERVGRAVEVIALAIQRKL